MNTYIAMAIFLVLGGFAYTFLVVGDSSLQAVTLDLFNNLITAEQQIP